MDYRLQWRDRPGLSPGSLLSLAGTWNVELSYWLNYRVFYNIVNIICPRVYFSDDLNMFLLGVIDIADIKDGQLNA